MSEEEVHKCPNCGAEMVEIADEWVCPCGCGTQYATRKAKTPSEEGASSHLKELF